MRLRFGLGDGRAMTLADIGRVFHISRERVRQIEVRTLYKLRQPYRSLHLDCSRNYDFFHRRNMMPSRCVFCCLFSFLLFLQVSEPSVSEFSLSGSGHELELSGERQLQAAAQTSSPVYSRLGIQYLVMLQCSASLVARLV
jgi:hypothetical protein